MLAPADAADEQQIRHRVNAGKVVVVPFDKQHARINDVDDWAAKASAVLPLLRPPSGIPRRIRSSTSII